MCVEEMEGLISDRYFTVHCTSILLIIAVMLNQNAH